MKILIGADRDAAERFLKMAGKVALRSTCLRARCGAVIVHNYNVIGEGFNSPPGDLEEQRRCLKDKADLHPDVTDKTCCIPAEQRAIVDALRRKPNKLFASDLYFARIDGKGRIEDCGLPYCTISSKFALDMRLSRVILKHPVGLCAYNAREYNQLSFKYGGED